MKKVTNFLLPPKSLRRRLVKKLLVLLGLKQNAIAGYYNAWIYEKLSNIEIQQIRNIKDGPLISIVVPSYNTPRRYLDALIYSIISQSYTNWELILVNASSDEKIKSFVRLYSNRDERIKVIDIQNRGIASTTNAGLKESKGAYIAFCDHDDLLDPFALYEVVLKIIDEKADIIYTDEDKVSDDGNIYFDPHFKPDWSPDLFTNVNYINHLTVVKKDLLDKAGLLRQERNGAQDYDFLLRAIDYNPKISHVPKVLYHWRAVPTSTAADFSSKKNITDAACLSLEEHFARNNAKVKVTAKDNQPGFYNLDFEQPKEISLVLMPFATNALLRLFVKALVSRSNFDDMRVHLIVPSGVEPKGLSENITLSSVDSGKDYINEAINLVETRYCIFIQQVVLPVSPDWVKTISGPLNLSHVGAVAPLIIRDGTVIEDAGLVKAANGRYEMLFQNQSPFQNQTFFGNTNWTRNVDALTGGICVVRTEEITKFVKTRETPKKLLFNYTKDIKQKEEYNTLFTQVVFDNFSIRMRPVNEETTKTFFSPNLVSVGENYEIYTPESAAINVLIRLNEKDNK